MITRTVIIFLLITSGLLAKKGGLLTKRYLIEVANKGGNEGVDSGKDEEGNEEGDKGGDEEGDKGGSDFPLNKKLRMVIDAGRGGKLSRFSVNVKKYVGDTLSLSCRVGSF